MKLKKSEAKLRENKEAINELKQEINKLGKNWQEETNQLIFNIKETKRRNEHYYYYRSEVLKELCPV